MQENETIENEPKKKNKTLSIIALVLGILSLPSCVCCGGGAILGVLAIISGIIALAKKKDGKVMSIISIVLGSLGTIFGVSFLAYMIFLGKAPSYVVPDVVGMNVNEAITTLNEAGFENVSVTENGTTIYGDYSDALIVESQDPVAGYETLYFAYQHLEAKDPNKVYEVKVEMPDVAGLSLQETVQVLNDLELTNVSYVDASNNEIDITSDEKWHVTKQSVKAGKEISTGEQVVITLEKEVVEEQVETVVEEDIVEEKPSEETVVAEEPKPVQEPKPTQETKPEETKPVEKTFLDTLKEVMDDELAEHVNSVLVDDLGFENLKLVGQMGETLNYEMEGSDISFVVTAVPKDDTGDEIIRVFAPNTGYTFYEDGEVIHSVSDMEMERYHREHCANYFVMGTSIVESSISTSRKIKFPNSVTDYQEVGYAWKDEYVVVQSYVYVENSYGGYDKYQWIAEFIPLDVDKLTYETVYVNVAGKETGEFVDIGTRYCIEP